jgi:SPX domain protein involved in polyphosphate accumulation
MNRFESLETAIETAETFESKIWVLVAEVEPSWIEGYVVSDIVPRVKYFSKFYHNLELTLVPIESLI